MKNIILILTESINGKSDDNIMLKLLNNIVKTNITRTLNKKTIYLYQFKDQKEYIKFAILSLKELDI